VTTITRICVLLAWLVMAVPVAAHSELVSSIPAAGATLSATPVTPIVLSFSETLKTGSHADVVGPDGKTAGTAAIDPGDDKKLSWSPPAPLAPGSWTIQWTSIDAEDGDVLRGTIAFQVAAASAAPSATPAASASPSDASSPGAGAFIPVIAALVVIALLGLVLLRGRRTTARR
jgi:methionine-rich copper-binding protein CopC